MYSVLIADDNKVWANTLASFLNQEDSFNVVAVIHDGLEAINFIETEKPDILILDIIMPNCDGTAIVNYINKQIEDYQPIIYILSGIGTSSVIKILNELNVDFYSMKPVSLDILLDNLLRVTKANSSNATPTKIISNCVVISDVVKDLGLVPDRTSTKCVITALEYCLNNKEYYGLLTKEVYPEIAKIYDLSSFSVERNIRIAIQQMIHKNTSLYNELFLKVSRTKITNSEFLSLVTTYIANHVY